MAKNISGKVVDSKGAGIPAASIIIRGIEGGQVAGTTATGEGGFVIQSPDNAWDYETEVSSVGYAPQQFNPATDASGQIMLAKEHDVLDAAIVYFKKNKPKKRTLAIAATIVLFITLSKRFL